MTLELFHTCKRSWDLIQFGVLNHSFYGLVADLGVRISDAIFIPIYFVVSAPASMTLCPDSPVLFQGGALWMGGCVRKAMVGVI